MSLDFAPLDAINI